MSYCDQGPGSPSRIKESGVSGAGFWFICQCHEGGLVHIGSITVVSDTTPGHIIEIVHARVET